MLEQRCEELWESGMEEVGEKEGKVELKRFWISTSVAIWIVDEATPAKNKLTFLDPASAKRATALR